jgi:hypothetical protein
MPILNIHKKRDTFGACFFELYYYKTPEIEMGFFRKSTILPWFMMPQVFSMYFCKS